MKNSTTQDLSELERFFNTVSELATKEVEYGFYDDAHYSGLNMATLAAIHEQGWNNLPERNFIYSTSVQFRADLNRLTKQMMNEIIQRQGYQKGLQRIGNAGSKKIAFTIDAGLFTNSKVSQEWAKVKGFDDAMKHYGDLKNAATFKVVKKSSE